MTSQTIVHRVMSTSRIYAPYVEHLATVNEIITPEGWKGHVAITKCGKAIRHYQIVDDISRTATDGSIFLVPCRWCDNEESRHDYKNQSSSL